MQAGNTGRVRYEYRTCPVYTISEIGPELAPFDFYLQTKLQALDGDDKIHREPAE